MTRLSRLLGSLLLALPLAAQAAIFTLGGGPGQLVMFGLVADTPPASADGAIFIEVDSAKVFLRTGGAWVEQVNSIYQPLATDLTRLVDNCALDNDATPIPDSCVGDGTDGGGGVDTVNSPNAAEVARFTDADTIEGRTAAEFKADLDLEVGTDLQAQDSDLASIAALTTTAHGRGLLDDTDAAASRSSLSLGTAATSATGDFGASNLDYLVGTATGGLSAEIAVGTSPGGELGCTWASPCLDDGLTVDTWSVTNATGTTAAANDSDTSLATTAFVQGEVDDGDNLTDNCALENDSTPIPDSCVGDGSDAGGSYSFNADGDNNTPQTIDNTNELLIAGGTNGIDTVAGATDTVTINLDLSESAAGGELGGTLDAPTIDDGVAVSGWTLTDPNYAAGSASAGTWPNYASGTVLTTAEDGTLEQDADNFYLTTDAGNRGTVAVEHWLRAASDQTLTSTTNAQSIFDSPANGRFTLETGTYVFEMQLQVTGMSGTSGNAQILLVCGGTCTDYNWHTRGMDTSTLTTIGADLDAYHLTNATAASVVTAGTGTGLRLYARGSFEVTGAGTFQPQIDLVTAAAAIVESGSYFMLKRIGSTSMTSVGQTD